MSSGCKMSAMSMDESFEKFEAGHGAQGFDEVMERNVDVGLTIT